MTWPIRAVTVGAVAPFRAPDEPSAIAKSPVSGAVAVGLLGIAGDSQADRVHHGGRDKAIHHYPADHYSHWREAWGGHALLDGPAAFGENISTLGLLEQAVCVGDRYRLGTALVEVSQGRQPCWKLNHRFGRKDVLSGVVMTRRSGWYYRVIEPGLVTEGDDLVLADRPLPDWSVDRVFGLLIAGDHTRDPVAVRTLAGMEQLAGTWRVRAVALAG